MRKLHKVLAALIASAFTLTAFGAVPAQAADPAKGEYTLSVNMQTGQIRLLPEDIIVITAQTNPTTGYTVSAKVAGKKKGVKLTKGFYAPNPNPSGAVGVGGYINWGLEALKSGVAYVVVTTKAPSGEVTLKQRLKIIVMAAK